MPRIPAPDGAIKKNSRDALTGSEAGGIIEGQGNFCSMTDHDGTDLADGRHDFLRQLPARAQVIARRLHRFAQGGWDINGLALIQDEASRLGERSAGLGLQDAATRQNAVAVGPASDSRTKIGDSAMQVAPRISAATAGFMPRRW